MKGFYFMGDDYRYHFELEAKRRFLGLLKDRFNSPVQYRGKAWQWDTIILNKVQELARFLLGKSGFVDFTEPVLILKRGDSLEIRSRIVELTQKRVSEIGICRSTLHHLKKQARERESFRIYGPVLERLTDQFYEKRRY